MASNGTSPNGLSSRYRGQVGALGRRRHGARMAAAHRLYRGCGPLDGRLGQLTGMGIAGRLADHRAQAKSLHGIETGRFHAAVVEGDSFRLTILQEQLAVIAARQRFFDDGLHPTSIEVGAIEEKLVGLGKVRHLELLRTMAALRPVSWTLSRRSFYIGRIPI